MRIIVAGASGFLGKALRTSLLEDGHAVTNLTRRERPTNPDDITWTPDGTAAAPWAVVVDSADAVVNLAGEAIAEGRWTTERNLVIQSSRLLATRSIVAAIRRAANPPRVLVNGSGIGYYGDRGEELVTEGTPPSDDFLARVCVEWEREAEQASSITRVAVVRTAMALHPDGGALAKMLTPFRLGVGGPIGSGRQYMPWIHRADWVHLVRWLISDHTARGAFNAAAPEPVRNADFARTLGRVLGRPAILPLPELAVRLMFGEMSFVLLRGQRAIPARALEAGFTFRFPRLGDALSDLCSRT